MPSDARPAHVVYLPAQGNGNGSPVAHTNPQCSRLQNARKIHEYPRESVPNKRICQYCRGEVPKAGGNNSGPWQALEAADPNDFGRKVAE